MRRPLIIIILTAALGLSPAACMKTRAQIKGDQGAEAGDTAASDDTRSSGTAKSASRYELEEMRNEINRIAGKLEEVDHNQQSAKVHELKEYMTRLDQRVADVEKNQLLIMTEVKSLKDRGAGGGAKTQNEPAESKDELFDEANQFLKDKEYDAAAEKFQAVLDHGARGKDAAEAHFGLGEALFGKKSYKKAIVEYSKVQESHAKSTRIPAALFRIGTSFQKINMNKDAKSFFSLLVERYPNSPEAKKAKSKVKGEE